MCVKVSQETNVAQCENNTFQTKLIVHKNTALDLIVFQIQ